MSSQVDLNTMEALDRDDWVAGIVPPLSIPLHISRDDGIRFMVPIPNEPTKCRLKVSLRVPIGLGKDGEPVLRELANVKIVSLIEEHMNFMRRKYDGLDGGSRDNARSNGERVVYTFVVNWDFTLTKFIMELAGMLRKVGRDSPYRPSVFDPSSNTTSSIGSANKDPPGSNQQQ